MAGKRNRTIAAAISFCIPAILLCLSGPARGFAADSQTGSVYSPPAAQNAGQNPAQGADSRETRPSPQDQNAAPNSYKPGSAIFAADVDFPFQTPADGLVVFKVAVGAQGQMTKGTVLQDVPPFTAAAEKSLQGWKFAPAQYAGAPEDSQMLVAFVFRHSVYIANEPPFTPVVPSKESAETAAFTPPGIVSVSYAAYPASTIAMGAVVVQVTVKADGSVGRVSIIRDLPGDFGKLAVNAAKHWKFQPAKRDGKSVQSKVAIAFVFSSRALNPF